MRSVMTFSLHSASISRILELSQKVFYVLVGCTCATVQWRDTFLFSQVLKDKLVFQGLRKLWVKNIISRRTLWRFNSTFGSSQSASSAYKRFKKLFSWAARVLLCSEGIQFYFYRFFVLFLVKFPRLQNQKITWVLKLLVA